MLDYIMIYLATGLVIVLTFQKPIRDKLFIIRMTDLDHEIPKWKFSAFAILLGGTMVFLWPFYLLVVWTEK